MRPVTDLFAPPSDRSGPTSCTIARRAVIPLRFRGLILVDVRINGGPATLILDTGAQRSVITADAAKRLAVTDRYDFNNPITGIGRVVQTGDARLQSFTLGALPLSNPRILVGGLELPGIGADGLLGADLLGDFDLDLDLPRRTLTLYDRLDCPTLRPPWTGRYATLETTRSLSNHPFFPVQVDGHTLTASFDSGAQRTLLSAAGAAAAGVTPSALAADPTGQTRGAGGETLATALHQFHEFRIGDAALRTPVLIASAALPRDVEAIIGLDVLASHRIWLSYGSRRIFIAPD